MKSAMFERTSLQRALRILLPFLILLVLSAPMQSSYAQTSFIVTTEGDSGDGTCDETCTLRDAIAAANSTSGADSITFALTLPNTINLTSPLIITEGVTISGPQAGSLTIDGGGLYRIFTIQVPDIAAGLGSPVSISTLTLANGGGVFRGGAVEIIDSMIADPGQSVNLSALTVLSSTATLGGAIYVLGDIAVQLQNSLLSNNHAVDFDFTLGSGGAIYNDNDTLTISNSTLSGNRAGSGDGGAILNNGTLTLVNSTLSSNATNGNGGAIANVTDGPTASTTIASSTIVSNSAGTNGGGIYNASVDGPALFELGNTILAGNVVSPTTRSNCWNDDFGFGFAEFLSQGNNLTEPDPDLMPTCTFEPDEITTLDIFTEVINPTLAGNGGPTPTHALLPGSPAIDGGDNCPPPSTDQRGVPRPLGAACDIGAYELIEPVIAVNMRVGTVPGACAATTSITVSANTDLYYCAILLNTGNITLTTNTILDPVLGVNVTLPIALAPGAIFTITNDTISGFGPISAGTGPLLVNSLTVTSTNGTDTATATGQATVNVPSVSVIKSVGVVPGLCAPNSSILVNRGTEVYYCATIRNTGAITLTEHILRDTALGVNVTLPFALAPGATLSVTDNDAAGLGPVSMLADTVNTLTLTSSVGTASATASASATVTVPTIAIAKTVATDPSGCAANSTLTEPAGAELYYCLTIRNSGSIPLARHTINDPRLSIPNLTIPFALAPGASVQVNNALLAGFGLAPLLGPHMSIADVNNSATITSTADIATATGANVSATNVATATVIWQPVQIQMTTTAGGTDVEATRTVFATVYQDNLENRIPNRRVGFDVTGGTLIPTQIGRTNSLGQAFFTYVSLAPPSAAQTRAAQSGAAGETVQSVEPASVNQAGDIIHVWVDLNGNGLREPGEPEAFEERPTAITLASFSAKIATHTCVACNGVNGKVVLSWRTSAEIDNAGFNLYRATAPNGSSVKINLRLIPGQGTGHGASYTYTDSPPSSGRFYYWLEDVDYKGVGTLHGPIEIRLGAGTAGSSGWLYFPYASK